MGSRSHKRNFNPGNLLVLLAVGALGLSFWIPYGTANRTARVEERAGEIAALLLEAASACQPLDLTDPGQYALIEARTLKAAHARGIPSSSFVDTELPIETLGWGSFLFRGKHYCFQVTLTPSEQLRGDTVPPVEVYAWPTTTVGPGHTVFFFSETDQPAFSRNLARGYAGTETAPRPGFGQPRQDDPRGSPDWYRGTDDERWIRFE